MYRLNVNLVTYKRTSTCAIPLKYITQGAKYTSPLRNGRNKKENILKLKKKKEGRAYGLPRRQHPLLPQRWRTPQNLQSPVQSTRKGTDQILFMSVSWLYGHFKIPQKAVIWNLFGGNYNCDSLTKMESIPTHPNYLNHSVSDPLCFPLVPILL